MKKIVFTCITNGVDDDPKDPVETQNDVDYICFTDKKNIKSKVWRAEPLIKKFSCPRLTARYHKIIGANELEADMTLWQDGKVHFHKSHLFLFNQGINFFLHPKRDCIYKEANRVIELKKDNATIIKKQIQKYKNEGFLPNYGLYETAIVVRDKNSHIFNEIWWNEIKNHSTRDQISLPYVLWKLNIKPNIYKINYADNNLFKVKEHEFIDYRKRIPLI